MFIDGMYFKRGTYEGYLKEISLKSGWKNKVREYVWERKYDGEKPTIEEISVYVLRHGDYKYLYTKESVIERR